MLQEKTKLLKSEAPSAKKWAKDESEYPFGFSTQIDSDSLAKGLNEDVVCAISKKRNEPDYMLQYRLKAFKCWKKMTPPNWSNLRIEPIDFQDISYYSAPVMKKKLSSLDELDPKIKETFDKLGLPLSEQKRLANVAVDAVFDSVSVATTFKKKLAEVGVIFCSISEAIREYPEMIQKYMGTVVPPTDNFYAALNTAVFTDGSFVYIPPNTRCPMELSTYFRINAQDVGQFERTLIICDDYGYVSYLEGCTAPSNDKNQLHAAIVELIVLDHAEIKYSTIQNWYPGDPKTGEGGIYNFVTKRAKCEGRYSKVSWTQVETGSAITWKYPSCILKGDHSVGEFYSIALTHHFQQADTGTKMIHLGKNTHSTIISKGISAGQSKNSYRGQVKVLKSAVGAKNYTQCDSMLVGDRCSAHTFPSIESKNQTAVLEHEATTSKISEEQLFYFQQRGIAVEDALTCIVNGFCKEVFKQLPVEFAVETSRLLAIKLENSVG